MNRISALILASSTLILFGCLSETSTGPIILAQSSTTISSQGASSANSSSNSTHLVQIQGSVYDQSGSPVPQALLTLSTINESNCFTPYTSTDLPTSTVTVDTTYKSSEKQVADPALIIERPNCVQSISEEIARFSSNDQGHFFFALPLADGMYQLTAEHESYFSSSLWITVAQGQIADTINMILELTNAGSCELLYVLSCEPGYVDACTQNVGAIAHYCIPDPNEFCFTDNTCGDGRYCNINQYVSAYDATQELVMPPELSGVCTTKPDGYCKTQADCQSDEQCIWPPVPAILPYCPDTLGAECSPAYYPTANHGYCMTMNVVE